jgi:branched-subunit amino acid transport protein
MTSRILLLIALAGLSTYLMRLVPLLITSRSMTAQKTLHPRLTGFLNGVGPSFVAVFLVYSLLPSAGLPLASWQLALEVAALVPVAAVYLKTGHFGNSVLAGLAGYGALYFLAGS